MTEVNDAQSRLNPTYVKSILTPRSEEEVRKAILTAAESGDSISMAGGRHSMGGQQFGTGTVHLDLRGMDRIVEFDRRNGLIEVEGGIMWPELIGYLHADQDGSETIWAVRQKQTGIDQVSIAGSLSSNIHGRGLRFPPFVSDIESFRIIGADGRLKVCSRTENRELFALAIGGYGLFGVVTRVTIRLVPRFKVKRMVEVIAVRTLMPRIDAAIEDGFLFGDCQYSIDLHGGEEFHPGVFSCYQPVSDDIRVPVENRHMASSDWADLYRLARTNKGKAFAKYKQFYLGTSGQVYWSDAHQLSNVFEGYEAEVSTDQGTEMITEVYVDRDSLVPFLTKVRQDFIRHGVDMTYGTIRFIEPDKESFLPWATRRSVCIVCNLHVMHTPEGIKKAQADFRRIIDRVIEYRGRFYLTYHPWATREQVETCYPRFWEFLDAKLMHDPECRFQSDWYRHYARLFGRA